MTEAFTASKELVVDADDKEKPERLLKRALSAVQSIDSENPRLKTVRAKAILDDLAARVAELRDFSKK